MEHAIKTASHVVCTDNDVFKKKKSEKTQKAFAFHFIEKVKV
jgi:hypothetical protein